MRCIGAANPPCQRCLKAGRQCETPALFAANNSVQSQESDSNNNAALQPRGAHSGDASTSQILATDHASRQSIPTIYNSSALETVHSLTEESAPERQASPFSRDSFSSMAQPSRFGSSMYHETAPEIEESEILDLALLYVELVLDFHH